MQYILLTLLISLLVVSEKTSATETIKINRTDNAPLFDGRCGDKEWKSATKFTLPAQTAIYLMHDGNSLYVCAKGKAEDYAVVDVYIENTQTNQFHNLHASAQLSESILNGDDWGEPNRWNLKQWSGFWVPYAGNQDYEGGIRPKFLKGSDREIQILKKKFSGDTWNMMFGISGVHQDGEYGARFTYPNDASDTDKSTWPRFSFSK